MARATKAGAEGQLPRDGADDKTAEQGVAHDHGDGDPHHMHRMGDLSHLHDENGKAVLLDEHGRPLFPDEDPDAKTEEWFKTEAQQQEQRTDAAATRRAKLTAAVTDDAPTEPAALIRAGSSSGTDAAIAAHINALARHAEVDYFANIYSYQVKTIGNLIGLLAEADRQLGERGLLTPDLIRRARAQVEGLAVQGRADNGDGGS